MCHAHTFRSKVADIRRKVYEKRSRRATSRGACLHEQRTKSGKAGDGRAGGARAPPAAGAQRTCTICTNSWRQRHVQRQRAGERHAQRRRAGRTGTTVLLRGRARRAPLTFGVKVIWDLAIDAPRAVAVEEVQDVREVLLRHVVDPCAVAACPISTG